MAEEARFAIGGGGLAGLALAWQLCEEGAEPASIVVIEGEAEGRGSDNPGAIFHPFPGTSVAPDARRLRRASATHDLLRTWRNRLDDVPMHRVPMVRPITPDDRGAQLEDSWPGDDAYPEWLEFRRVDGEELAAIDPHVDPREADWDAAFVYGPAYCLSLRHLGTGLSAALSERGVRIYREAKLSGVHSDDGRWVCGIESAPGAPVAPLRTRRLVLAFGRSFGRWFPNLAIECRGGELLVTERPPSPRLSVALNADGHLAPRSDGRIVAGSTYWNVEAYGDRQARRARDAIVERCADLFPPLRELSGRIWRGIRVSFGDYQPLVGPIPGHEALYALGAFGGTGLLSVPLHARELARFLLDEPAELPSLGRPDRMGAEKWKMHPEMTDAAGRS